MKTNNQWRKCWPVKDSNSIVGMLQDAIHKAIDTEANRPLRQIWQQYIVDGYRYYYTPDCSADITVENMVRVERDHYLFVIDTDSYAGNFEREMCAYITGQVGNCEVGEENAEIAKQEIPEIVVQLEELIDPFCEDGCCRPCSIYSTPGWFNNGMGGCFREGQEIEALEHYKQATLEYYKDIIKRVKATTAGMTGWTDESKNRELERLQAEIDKTNALKEVHKYPAYMSVAICFHKKPHDELIEIMKKRAINKATNKMGSKPIQITGFRLLKEHTTTVLLTN